MIRNVLLGTTGLFLLSGSLLLLWFVILGGITHHTPLSHIYFLRADTSDITGARPITQWTYFRNCGLDNLDCGNTRPAPPFGKGAWSSNPDNAPPDLVGSHGSDTTSRYYFYMWRFTWVFMLLTLFFETLAFFAAWISCFGRLGAAIAAAVAFIALFFHTLGTTMMTATFVKARNVFQGVGRSAKVGPYAFGFMWASWTALFLAVLLFGIGIKANRKSESGYTGRSWRRKRSVRQRSRSYDGRRVKDEYA